MLSFGKESLDYTYLCQMGRVDSRLPLAYGGRGGIIEEI